MDPLCSEGFVVQDSFPLAKCKPRADRIPSQAVRLLISMRVDFTIETLKVPGPTGLA